MRVDILDRSIRRLLGWRRPGVDVNVSEKIKHITLEGSYTFLDASYENSKTVAGGNNSVDDRGLEAVVRSFARSNENNLDQNWEGDFPIRSTTFFAPGAPIGAWGGIRFTF